ncbi:hypothetical protein [Jiangella sp. DSM 45060]|uniref:hypothetical protein n=1 Tax=Jiangella sp. DSM 45060 TaxID=1798224 RepID=UPI00087A002A|nr:hypothetical protein [Jiangella sp. DSM 45060]SDS23740.1 hypothetical protein SAMN04515669_0639 [Jiangella sp. DSM 45060]
MSTSLATGTTQETTTAVSRVWAYTGVLAGLAGVAGIQASMSVSAVYDEETQGDAAAILAGLRDFVPNIVVFHVTMMLATVLLVVFAAGLRRRLRAQAPADSVLPDVAAFGLLLTSVAGLIGTGLNTEFAFALADDEAALVPEAAVVFGHWIGTLPWLWVGAGITGTALAVAALRHAAAPRWIGWVAAVLGGLTLLLGISPLQYMAGMTGPVLVLVVAAGFVWGDRSRT